MASVVLLKNNNILFFKKNILKSFSEMAPITEQNYLSTTKS